MVKMKISMRMIIWRKQQRSTAVLELLKVMIMTKNLLIKSLVQLKVLNVHAYLAHRIKIVNLGGDRKDSWAKRLRNLTVKVKIMRKLYRFNKLKKSAKNMRRWSNSMTHQSKPPTTFLTFSKQCPILNKLIFTTVQRNEQKKKENSYLLDKCLPENLWNINLKFLNLTIRWISSTSWIKL